MQSTLIALQPHKDEEPVIIESRNTPTDAGVYLFALKLGRPRTVAIGSLGNVRFEKGWYVYVGSARRGLSRRLARHERKTVNKVMRWHIDYLRAHAQAVQAFPILTCHDLECHLAKDVRIISDGLVRRFGCSDCSCPSHLFRFEVDPIDDPRFVELLRRYKHRVAIGK
jgi:sugar fermentation stimulation protein A